MPEDRRTVEPPSGPFLTGVRVPGDKSLSHRALILAAMAEGESRLSGLAPGADVAATLRAIQDLGVEADRHRVKGGGQWHAADGPIDCGNSGTAMRLLTGATAGRPFTTTLVGDESLMARPMGRLVGPLTALGAVVDTGTDGLPPVTTGGGVLVGTDAEIDVASAQVRSAFELAALRAEGSSTISSPAGYRDHTERWLEAFGLGEAHETTFRVDPGPVPVAGYDVPGDPSSAAYLWASAAILDGAQVATPDVSLNPGRLGLLSILDHMGATVHGEVTGAIHGDPTGVTSVAGSGLHGVEVSGSLTVAALDELPLVAVLGAYAEGTTVVLDADELRVKESDRIASTVAMIRNLGGEAEETDDGFAVIGTGALKGGTVDAADDHRIAMAAAVAATGATGPVTIEGASIAAVSWPTFYDTLEAVWSSQSTAPVG